MSKEQNKEENKSNVLISKIYNKRIEQYFIKSIRLKENEYKNNNIIESYIFTNARYNLSIHAQRILYRSISCFQCFIEKKQLNTSLKIEPLLEYDVTITLPISSLVMNIENNNNNKNYEQLKQTLIEMLSKTIKYKNKDTWKQIHSIIMFPKINKIKNTISFRLHQKIYEVLFNFSKGYRKYELETIIHFNNIYSMRLYALISEQKKSITYNIDDWKSMFQLENKYSITSNFIDDIIEPAKKELDSKAPYSFTYQVKSKIIKMKKKTIKEITLKPIYFPRKK